MPQKDTNARKEYNKLQYLKKKSVIKNDVTNNAALEIEKNEPTDKELNVLLLKQNNELLKQNNELLKKNNELLEIIKNNTNISNKEFYKKLPASYVLLCLIIFIT